MGTEGTRVELDFQSAVITDGGRVEIFTNGPELETIVSKLYESNEVVSLHIVVEATGQMREVCGFVDPNEESKYRWACKQFLNTDGTCPREEDHAKKRQAALQPELPA